MEKPKAPDIDPQARALMDQMIAAYKGLKSYSGTAELVSTGVSDAIKQKATIAFQRPNQVDVEVTSAQGTAKLVCDGTTLFVRISEFKTQYIKNAAPTSQTAIAGMLQSLGAAGPGLTPLVAGVDPLPPGEKLKSLTVGQPETLDGVPVETVIARPEAGLSEVTITLAIGRDDHLLRGLTLTETRNNDTITLAETHTNVKANPALTSFKFTPPPGAKAVKQFIAAAIFDPRLKVGTKPPPFKINDLAGKPLSLDQYAGKVVLLDFWATWCLPCIVEMSSIVAAYNKYKSQGFDVIGISLDVERGRVDKFIAQFKMPWRQFFDGRQFENQVAKLYGVQSIPFALLIGRDGKIAAVDLKSVDAEAAIKAALAKKVSPAMKMRQTKAVRKSKKRRQR